MLRLCGFSGRDNMVVYFNLDRITKRDVCGVQQRWISAWCAVYGEFWPTRCAGCTMRFECIADHRCGSRQALCTIPPSAAAMLWLLRVCLIIAEYRNYARGFLYIPSDSRASPYAGCGASTSSLSLRAFCLVVSCGLFLSPLLRKVCVA